MSVNSQPLQGPAAGSLDLGREYPASCSLLNSAARTTTQTVEFAVGDHTNVLVVLTATNSPGAGGITLTVQSYDPAADAWETIATATQLTAAGTKRLLIGPNVIAVANIAVVDIIRPRLRAVVTAADSTSYTYSLAAHASK